MIVDGVPKEDPPQQLPFLTVAVGIHAGNLEACIKLFSTLPSATNIAFVAVSRLTSEENCKLLEALTRHASLPLSEITNETSPEVNRVVLLAASSAVFLENGLFRGVHCPEWAQNPIDAFFHSLAIDQKNHALGVLLEGTDPDGAAGLRAIREEGGIAILQSPESTFLVKNSRARLRTTDVHFALPAEHIGGRLAQIAEIFQQTGKGFTESPTEEDDHEYFQHTLALLRRNSGIDFRAYQPVFVLQKIRRRMLLTGTQNLFEYAALLDHSPEELNDLQEDILSKPCRFLCKSEVFDALKDSVLPQIRAHTSDQQVRIWIPGCSSGEEVYSIAICLHEYLTSNSIEIPVQIFGTDPSDQSISTARAGTYNESIAEDLSAERLHRFFIRTEDGYKVAKNIREMCVFARQVLIQDPPLSRMDLICYRNALAHFTHEVQRQIVPIFHYSLRQNGHLLLGPSETVYEFTGFFKAVDHRQRIYQRAGGSSAFPLFDVSPRLPASELQGKNDDLRNRNLHTHSNK